MPATLRSTRVTFERSTDNALVWSPDGQQLAFQGVRDGKGALILLTISSLHEESLLTWTPGAVLYRPSDWSVDGRSILYTVSPGTDGLGDIGVLSVADRKPRPYVQTPGQEANATFSPDGKWVAYNLYDEGQPQVFVRRFPPTEEKYQVSVNGGLLPKWSRDGKELFFLTTDRDVSMMAVDVDAGAQFHAGPPHRLFAVRTPSMADVPRQYAVSRDAKRFLVAIPQRGQVVPLTVVMNWLSQPK